MEAMGMEAAERVVKKAAVTEEERAAVEKAAVTEEERAAVEKAAKGKGEVTTRRDLSWLR